MSRLIGLGVRMLSSNEVGRVGLFLLCLVQTAVLLLWLQAKVGVEAQAADSLQWEVHQLSNPQEENNNPVIAADQSGGIHVLWSWRANDDSVGGLYYGHNAGSGWFSNDIVAERAEQPSMAIDGSNVLHAVWRAGGADQTGIRYSFARLDQAGSARGWAEPVTVADGLLYYPQLLIDVKNVLHLAYAAAEDPSSVQYSRSVDGGHLWEAPVIFEAARPGSVVVFPQMAQSKDGTLHLVWSLVPRSNLYGGMGVYYARSTDAGVTWSNPTRLDEKTNDVQGEGAWQVSIAVVGSSEVHVVWDVQSEGGAHRHKWSRDGGLTFSDTERIWSGFRYQTGPNPMIVDSSGTLYLFSSGSFDWNAQLGVYYGVWTGSAWTDPQLIDQTTAQPHYLQLALTEGNKIHVVWETREQKPPGLWYASARTSAPRIQPQSLAQLLSAPTPSPLGDASATVSKTVGESSGSKVTSDKLAGGTAESSDNYAEDLDGPQKPAFAAIVPVVALLGAVVLFERTRAKRS